jgi:hypothetical protein
MRLRVPATRCARGLQVTRAPEIRGRRERRMRAAPAVSCARLCKEAHTSIQVQRRQSGIPCAMALRLISCSPRRRIRLVTVAGGLRFCRTRLGSQNLRQLDTSNGCQDHTVLPYASASFVCVPLIAHGRTALRSPCARNAAASTATRPNVRDHGQRPSLGTGWMSSELSRGQLKTGIFSSKGIDSYFC